ncbi:hypothetical protein L6V77_25160 [Myxococcota bacterium]|nr:hypothetical protein [Myxococcota bacterium]
MSSAPTTPLDADSVADRIRPGSVRLLFDTSGIRIADPVLRRITERTAIWNEHLRHAGRAPITLAVSALAHAERIAQVRRRVGSAFNHERLYAGLLVSKGIAVAAFDEDAAVATAEALVRRFPTNEAWQAAKRPAPDGVPTHRVSATVDWFIAGHASPSHTIACVGDAGTEWAHIVRCTAQTLDAALGRLLQTERPTDAPA